jgi:ribosome biogenesis GTPase
LDFPFRVATDRGVSFEVLAADGAVATATFDGFTEPRPVVGDYVVVDPDRNRITAVAPRRSWIARARADGSAQPIAANVTTGLIVTSPEPREFSPRRIVRYLLALRAGGVEPVIVLNKIDGCADLHAYIAAVRNVADGAAVIPVSALNGTNCEALDFCVCRDATVVLCGSSGVGKSTLFNRLAGADLMPTTAMRDDGRGRHTTSVRRLVALANGASLIDTPGMRAFTPWAGSDELDEAFSDVAVLAKGCRFRNCRHEDEPQCAVRQRLSSERFEQWHKLQRELAWVESREDVHLARARKREWKRIHKAARAARI